MKKKLLIILPVLLLLVGGGYKFVFAKSSEPKPKVHGVVYPLPKEFLINLADARFAKMNVALVLDHEMEEELASEGHGPPPEGFGPLPQEALVRDLVTDTLTDADADELISSAGRKHIKEKILKQIEKHTDVKAHEVLITDLAIQ
jgi:flagellar basal body-associated protein FliL